MSNYDEQGTDDQLDKDIQQLNGKVKQKASNLTRKATNGARKNAKKIGKNASNAIKKSLAQAMKVVGKALAPFIPYILAIVGIILAIVFLLAIAFQEHENQRGKTAEYQHEDYDGSNALTTDDDGNVVANGTSSENKIVKAFYSYFSEESYYVRVGDDKGIYQAGSSDFTKKYGPEVKDKYGRETMFCLNPNVLWSLDEFLNSQKFRFPEQFIKPVYYDKDTFALKDLTNSDGSLAAQSTKYSLTDEYKNTTQELSPTTEKIPGVWDYGFASILHYNPYTETKENRGNVTHIQKWNKEKQEFERVEATGDEITNYTEETYRKGVYLIDQVTSPSGLITNKVVQEWKNSAIPFSEKTETFTATVPVRYYKTIYTIKRTKQKIKLDDNNVGMLDENGNPIYEDDGEPTTYEEEKTEYEKNASIRQPLEYKYEIDSQREDPYYVDEQKIAERYINGTIWNFIPEYEGDPDTSQITGSKYFIDYMKNYTTYIPRNVMSSFDFKTRTGGLTSDKLTMLFPDDNESTDTKLNAGDDSSAAKIGSGENTDSFSAAKQYYPYVEKYSKAFGVDPYLVLAMITQESGGKINSDNGAGFGLMQLEMTQYANKPMTIKYLDGTTEIVTPTYDNMRNNPEMQIKCGVNELRMNLEAFNFNIPAAIYGYNFGAGGIKYCIKHYAQEKFGDNSDTKVQEIINSGDLGWFDYRQWYSTTGYKEINAGGGGTWNHFELVMSYYVSQNGELPWILDGNSKKVSMSGSYDSNGVLTNITTGTSVGSVKANGIGGSIISAWTAIKDYWKTLFYDVPDKLSDQRYKYDDNQSGEKSLDIIKMMFVMEEKKYFTEYDNFSDEIWKAKYYQLFKNPFGASWTGSGSGATRTWFENGYTVPLSIKPLTVKKPYGIDDAGAMHNGIDIVAPKGTAVYAMDDGAVTKVSNDAGVGKTILITHTSGAETFYASLDTINVKPGDKVTRGCIIGTTGDSAGEGEVLHFELRKGVTTYDPSWIFLGDYISSDYSMSADDEKKVQSVINLAKTYIGYPYVWGGSGQDLTTANITMFEQQFPGSSYSFASSFVNQGMKCFDCSGLVQYCYKQAAGISTGRTTYDQMNLPQVDKGSVQPGDILIMENGGHVGIYLGKINGVDMLIHAPSTGKTICTKQVSWASVYKVVRPIASS